MATKIVRDIGRKGSFIISIKDEDIVRPKKNKGNLLDISSAGKQKIVVTRSDAKDAAGILENKKIPEQVFFFRIDPEKSYKFDRINEIIRVAAAGIMILFVINVINIYQRGVVLRNSVVAQAYSGYEELQRAGEQTAAQDYGMAENTFSEATSNFNLALRNISFLQTNRDAFFAREKTVDSVQALLEAAKSISTAGGDFARGIGNLTQLPELFLQANSGVVAAGGGTASGVAAGGVAAGGGAAWAAGSAVTKTGAKASLTERLKEDLSFIEKAAEEIRSADGDLARVSASILPPQFRGELDSAKVKVKKLLSLLDSARRKIPAVLELLGDRYPHRYLVLLQNDTEARPTGGFIGSFMIIDINDGYITKMEFHDVYDFDGQLQEDIPAPEEDIARVSSSWRLRDSNYSPDFTVSAEKAAWFLQKEKGPSVDTVIAVNQSVVAGLLEVTGPVKIEGLAGPLDKDNYQTVLSYIIESKLAGAENPKKILEEFISAFRQKLFTSDNWKKSLAVFINACRNKSVLLYSRNERVQAVFDELGLSGRVTQTAPGEDYLDVITTSIGGNKSDLYMSQSIQHNTLVNNTGLLVDEVTIKRKHVWTDETTEQVLAILRTFGYGDVPDGIKDILGRGINKSYVKIYVPEGSTLLSAAGIKKENVLTRTDDLIKKTYFMFEMDVAPGLEKKITISYQLPQNLELLPVDTYRFYAQRQPGIRPSYLIKQVFFKSGLQSYRQYPDTLKKYESGNLYYDGELKGDLYLSAVVGN